MCDLCREPIDGDSFGQTTADTIICARCLKRLEDRRELDARPDFIVDIGKIPDDEVPKWACSQWGQYEHDWLSCPDCLDAYEKWLEVASNAN